MGAGTRIGRRAAAALMAAAVVSTAGFLLACASGGGGGSQERQPGMYNLTGWNSWTQDINGEVGHRLYVNGPTALCHPSRKWQGNTRIVSGRLPPGLSLKSGSDAIEGIPQERGHWIVTLELYNVRCQDKSYEGLKQELRFHITGSGRVVQ